MRDLSALLRSRWTRAYWLAAAGYGLGFSIGLYALARDLSRIGGVQ